MDKTAGSFSTDQGTMAFIGAWMADHITVARYQPAADGARVRELAAWLRRDAADNGIEVGDIDRAVAGAIGGGHGLESMIGDAMAAVADAAVATPDAARLADEDI